MSANQATSSLPRPPSLRPLHAQIREPDAPLAEAPDRGQTFIDDDVISVIGRLAAEQVPGIHQLGDSTLRGMLGRFGRSAGVDAEVGLQEAAVDIEIVVEFGYSIREVARALREQIIATIESMTGRHVVEVNVYVVDVHVPTHTTKRRRAVE